MATERQDGIPPQHYEETDLHELALAPSRLFPHRLFDLYPDEQRIVRKNGQEVNLSTYECKILELLCANPNRVLTREQMLRYASGADDSSHLGSLKTIDQHISKLRNKVKPQDSKEPVIETVIGVGYRLNDPDRPLAVEIVELSNEPERTAKLYKHPGFTFNPAHMQIENTQGSVKLTPKEIRLLTYLMKNADRLLGQEELLHRFWPRGKVTSLRAHISNLRGKLNNIGVEGAEVIKSVNGLGFVFVTDVDKYKTNSNNH